ncbi:MAG: hypothetical protein A2166_02095 [Omnitrophica WOR_2 bacterium RBG_13_41_10]|nr:MAG: hypothetical protein A2166_02095 [Omnitrophica WOR_2 bacterium RBG_13_41_10]
MKDTMYSFEESLRIEKKKSENTIQTYLQSVDQFLKSAKNNPPNKEDVQRYLKNLHKQSINTVNVRLSALRAYFEYKQLAELFTYINILERDTPVNEPVKSALDSKKLAKMRAYFIKNNDCQSLLIFDLLSDYGARIAEVLALRKKDFTENGVSFFMTKTKRYRVHPLTPHAKESYAAYLKSADVKDYLFLTDDKQDDESKEARLYRNISKLRHKVRRRLLRCEKSCNIAEESPHKLRHHRATALAPSMNAFELKDFFGWKTLSIAATYVNTDMKRVNNKALEALKQEQEALV